MIKDRDLDDDEHSYIYVSNDFCPLSEPAMIL